MLKNRWFVFTLQVIAVAILWGLFLAVVAKHPLDGPFAVLVVGVALIVPAAALWRSSR